MNPPPGPWLLLNPGGSLNMTVIWDQKICNPNDGCATQSQVMSDEYSVQAGWPGNLSAVLTFHVQSGVSPSFNSSGAR